MQENESNQASDGSIKPAVDVDDLLKARLPERGPRADLNINDRRELAEHAAARRQLKEIFDPLAATGAERVQVIIDLDPQGTREEILDRTTDVMPYGEVYIHLPPDLFEGEEPVLPGKDMFDTKAIRAYAREFVERKRWTGTDQERQFYQVAPGNDKGEDTVGTMTNLMEEAHSRGGYIDPNKWRQYEQAYQRARQDGREFDFQLLWLNRSNNTHRRYDEATGRNTGFVFATEHTEEVSSTYNDVVVPIGEYGEEFARDLARTTAWTIQNLDSAVNPEADEIVAHHAALLAEHLARANDGHSGRYAPKAALNEGALSVMQTITLLTSSKVEGYEDPNQLMHDLVDQGMIEKLARMVPMGFVGPLALAGEYFPNTITVDSDGRLQLTAKFEATIRRLHVEYVHSSVQKHHNAPDGQYPHTGLGLTCPAAGKDGGVRKVAELMDSVQRLITSG